MTTNGCDIPSASAERRRTALLAGLLVLATLAVFWPARHCQYLNFDDDVYVTSNPRVRSGLTWRGVGWAFTSGRAGNWHPLTWLSHMADAALFGPGPAGPHAINVLWHTANALLLFLLLRQWTGALRPAAFAAFLFALHPLQVESVAWIAERKTVLSMFFGLLTLWAYGRYVMSKVERRGSMALEAQAAIPQPDRSNTTPQTPALDSRLSTLDRHWYPAALLFFGLALMAKPMLVTLPCLLLLLDFWPLRRLTIDDWRSAGPRLVREKAPFFVLSAVSCAVTFIVQQKAGAVHSLSALPLLPRLENAIVAYARYLGKIFWPVDLALPYPHPGHWPGMSVAGAAVLLAVLSAGAVWLARRLPFLATGWYWFAGALLPVIGLVQVGIQSMADRYVYLPLIGIALMVAWLANAVLARWRAPRAVPLAAAIVVLAACAARTRDQLGCWRDSGALFRHAIAATAGNYLAWDNLGSHEYRHGRIAEAVTCYREALQINPRDPTSWNGLGTALHAVGRRTEAIRCYESALRFRPAYADAHNNLGAILNELGRTDEAMAHCREAIGLAPDDPRAYCNLGNIQVARGNVEAAISAYQQALRADPDSIEALSNLGWTLAGKGAFVVAITCYQRALQLQPDDAQLRRNFGQVLAGAGRLEDAIAQYYEAVRLAPSDTAARAGLGRVLKRAGRRDEAAAQFREVLRLKPGDAEAARELQQVKR